MLATKMGMVFMKFIATHWKAFGRYCVVGYVRARVVSQEKLPFYVGFFEWLHNLRKRGRRAVHETFCLLLKPDLKTYEDSLIIRPI